VNAADQLTMLVTAINAVAAQPSFVMVNPDSYDSYLAWHRKQVRRYWRAVRMARKKRRGWA
jgi:hypothetical protein